MKTLETIAFSSPEELAQYAKNHNLLFSPGDKRNNHGFPKKAHIWERHLMWADAPETHIVGCEGNECSHCYSGADGA